MATNQAIDGHNLVNVAVPAAVTVGMPILIGTLSGVVLALQPIAAGAGSYTTATVDLGEDCYFLTVVGASSQSPVTNEAIKPGQELYASGTYDAVTNVTYNLTIDRTVGNTPFGNSLDAVAAGVTSTSCRVRLKQGGSGAYAG